MASPSGVYIDTENNETHLSMDVTSLSKVCNSIFICGAANKEILTAYDNSIGILTELTIAPEVLVSFTEDGLDDESIKQIL